MIKTPHKPRLLITGANGRLGRLLRAAWAQWPDAPLHPVFAARRVPADLLIDAASPLPDMPICDAVVALWGQTSGDATELSQNTVLADATRAVALACQARCVFHISSAAIYGPGIHMQEQTSPAPHAPYGESKLVMERHVAKFETDTAQHVCLRLANVVGADSLAPALTSKNPVQLDRFEDGAGPLRSYVCPGDLARILSGLACLPPDDLPSILNIAAPDPVAMADLAHAAGRDIRWRPALANATQIVTLDTTQMTALLPQLRLHKRAEEMIVDWQKLQGAQ